MTRQQFKGGRSAGSSGTVSSTPSASPAAEGSGGRAGRPGYQAGSRTGTSRGTLRNVLLGLLGLCILGAVLVVPFLGQAKKPVLRLATKPMIEQLILSEMLARLITDETGLAVKIYPNIVGGTETIHPALVRGDYDLYPEYTGTGWAYVLKREDRPDDAELYEQLCRLYEQKYGLVWTGLYGFNNSYSLGIRKEIANAYNLHNFSDLAGMADVLRFGAEPDFYRREDGFQALAEVYGLKFIETRYVDIADKYQEIIAGNIDVMNVFTTDGQLGADNVALLEDDRKFYPTYYCGTVVRREVLEKYPAVLTALKKLDGLISSAEMAHLNYEVELMKRQPQEVALEFLARKNLLARK